MKKLIFITLVACLAFTSAHTQVGLWIKGSEKNLYLDHIVKAKEGLYSIGRLYNVNPKHIATYNKIDLNKGLNIEQVIRIPLTDTNFSQKASKGVPVYYTVAANEGLQKVSNVNNKVPLANLRKWNSITGDNIRAGAHLVVGYLQSKDMTAEALAGLVQPVEKPVVEKATDVAVRQTPEDIAKPGVEEMKIEEKKTEKLPVITKAEPVKENKQEIKEEPKKNEQVLTKEENKSTADDNGYFKPYFDQQVRNTPATRNPTVTAGIFKTVSGWQDAKYYMLIDGVPAGNIVKVVNPENNKIVYAKVLGEMNGIRQNQGLGMRLSNAAASALGISASEKFTVVLNY